MCFLFFSYTEVNSATVDTDGIPRLLKTKMITLGQAHYPSEKYFPLPLIVKLLEQYSCEKCWNVKFVYQTLREIGVSCVDLLPLYDQLFKARVSQDAFCVKFDKHLSN